MTLIETYVWCAGEVARNWPVYGVGAVAGLLHATWKHRTMFRRAPPHLRGRVPVECGVGTTPVAGAYMVCSDNGSLMLGPYGNGPAWVPPPDAVGRAFLATMPPVSPTAHTRACDCTGAPHLWEKGCPSTERERRAADQHAQHWPEDDALTSAKRKAYAAADAGRPSAQVTAEEYAAVLRDTATHRWHAHVGTGDFHLYGVRLEVRPAPAENARRYTQEESTW